jgi:hypothetical protein
MPAASLARAQGTSGAQGGASPIATSIASRTSGYEKSDGFIPLYFDPRQGKLLLELPHDSIRALLVVTQATGLGSNPIGIDRGSDAGTDVVRFDRDGERVLVALENWSYRSSAFGNADHQRTVREAFAPSTVASLPIVAAEGGRLVVDATDLVMRDWNRVGETLASSRQGTYTVARDRSSIFRPYTKAFPENTEIDVALTFATDTRSRFANTSRSSPYLTTATLRGRGIRASASLVSRSTTMANRFNVRCECSGSLGIDWSV